MNEEIKKKIEEINNNLNSLNKNISDLISLLTKLEGEKQGYVSFNFSEPLLQGKGLENFLMKVLKEKSIEYKINRNDKGEIYQLLLKGNEKDVDNVLKVCNWINNKLGEK